MKRELLDLSRGGIASLSKNNKATSLVHQTPMAPRLGLCQRSEQSLYEKERYEKVAHKQDQLVSCSIL